MSRHGADQAVSYLLRKDAAVQQGLQNQKTTQLQAHQISPKGTSKKTLQQVNADAPTITDSSTGVSVKPVASSQVVSDGTDASQASSPSSIGGAANTVTASATPAGQQQTIGTSDPKAAEQATVTSTSGLDQDQITGDTISQIVGVRIATPFFGTGFNFCVDRYFSSFPKVGIVIPNPAMWLLPEFQDLATGLATTLSLPDTLLHGAFVTPTGDGFLINMPSLQPSQLSNLGIRYGIQIGQAFGWDFGYGIIKDICFVDFVIV
ncbi:g12292 [Coccomyxa viridis]|uniref:G12292 protein n=1 Tax=Coccomyxa viridis TaxID=1274662 RepID=A0ABP1GFJ3_9CHLO